MQKTCECCGKPMVRKFRHRIMCGDSTNKENVDLLMDGQKADTVFTSPPYNVGIKYKSHDDKMNDEKYDTFIKSVARVCYSVLNDGMIMAWNNGVSPKSRPHRHMLALEEAGFVLYRQIIWKKTGAQIPLWQNTVKNPKARYYLPNYNHEMIYMVSKGKPKPGADTIMDESISMDVWNISQFSAGGHNHPAAFPVSLAEVTIQALSAENESLFEPFLGSGTTLIACEKIKRKCFGMEIDPQYCQVIINRFKNYAGIDAVKMETTG